MITKSQEKSKKKNAKDTKRQKEDKLTNNNANLSMSLNRKVETQARKGRQGDIVNKRTIFTMSMSL